jgi:hypothetical protein
MFEEARPTRDKLEALVLWSSKSAVAKDTGLDRTNIRGILKGDRGIGPATRERIDAAHSRTLNKRFGVPALRFPKPFDKWLDEIRAIGLPEEKAGQDKAECVARLRCLYFQDKLSILPRETFAYPGVDADQTVRRAAMDIIGAHINWRIVQVLKQANEVDDRRRAPHRAATQFAEAAKLLRHAKENQVGEEVEWSGAELQALIGYARFNQFAVLSEFRHERHEMNGGFSVFSDGEIEKLLKKKENLDDVRCVLNLYPAGHPNRLPVAANTLVIGSLAKESTLALEGWQALAAEDPCAADLTYRLPTHDRPLAESSQTAWLRKMYGLNLPSVQ